VSAHRSAITRYPPRATHDSDHPFISYYGLLEDQEVGDCGLYHHLYILIQVLVRFLPGSYRREYRPLRNPYPHYTFTRYPLPSTNLSRTFTDPLPLRNTLRTITDPLSTSANSILTRYETSLTRYELSLTLYIIYGRPALH
jgi:hypothetical protein